MSSHNKTPMCELSSSTSPMAWTRKLFLLTRRLSPKPVVPSSPVRVAICVSRLDMFAVPEVARILSVPGHVGYA